uniref:Ribonuclease H-like domain-containing protein n=1 Tax=Tanacetum cinerariifolium TaxID=118510 RepID=A0A699GP77_TANCI|nr:ribonuclease H-like domain-containing protein [Tanacetum cinerariifolium]
MKLEDLSIDAYFRKIESISTILLTLGSPIRNDDVVNISLDGEPNKYQHVSDIIIHWDPFLILKMVCSMLTTTKMRLKSRAQATFVDYNSSSPMVLLANPGINTWRFTPSTEKDFLTRWVLIRCDSTGDLYPVTKPSTIPRAFLASQYTWHQLLGHPKK